MPPPCAAPAPPPNNLRVAKLHAPVAAVAERLVLRRAAAAQCVMLLRRAVAELDAHQLDATGHGIGTIVGDDHFRWPLGILRLYAVDRVAQRTGGTFANRGDDLLHRRAIGIDPRFLAVEEHGLEPIAAMSGMRADGAIVEDGDALAGVARAPVVGAVAELAVGETDRAVRAIAERLVLRPPAAAQRHAAHVGAGRTRLPPEVRDLYRLRLVDQVIGPIGHGAHSRLFPSAIHAPPLHPPPPPHPPPGPHPHPPAAPRV